MTGEKNRLKTHEQLWKLEDGDLSTPQHDELVLQLLNKKNISKIDVLKNNDIINVYNVYWDTVRLMYRRGYSIQSQVIDYKIQSVQIIEDGFYNIISEKPVMNGKFIIGYIDVFLEFNKIFDGKKDSYGFYVEKLEYNYDVCIEVKPVIKSFGETLRQIRTYQQFMPDAYFLLYSPDARFKAAFETQGINLITPSDIGLK